MSARPVQTEQSKRHKPKFVRPFYSWAPEQWVTEIAQLMSQRGAVRELDNEDGTVLARMCRK